MTMNNALSKFFLNYQNEAYMKKLEEIEYRFEVNHDTEKKVTEITMYGIFASSIWSDTISAKRVAQVLDAAEGNDIIIHLNSPGGDVAEGIAIANRLLQYQGNVTTYVDGFACSAGSLIPLVSDDTIMGVGSMMMIHPVSTFVYGDEAELLKEAKVLAKMTQGAIDIYMLKAKIERDEMETMVKNETWFTAREALAIGFATELSEVQTSQQKDNQVDSEQYKNNVLARFMKHEPEHKQTNNFFNKFKRNSIE